MKSSPNCFYKTSLLSLLTRRLLSASGIKSLCNTFIFFWSVPCESFSLGEKKEALW